MAAEPGPVVVGAGIGGLACAAALGGRGLAALLLERAPALAEVGAGLQLTPNGMRVLAALGLGSAVDSVSIPAQAVEPMDALSGRRVARFALSGAGPYRFLHRADLIDLLRGAAEAAGATLRLGTSVAEVEAGALVLGDRTRIAAGLVIGADGLRSVVREAMGEGGAPFFTGQTAWRAVVEAEHPPVARIWMAPGRHVVTYPLPGGRLNVVAVQEAATWAAEGWHHDDDPANLRAAFADVAEPLGAMLARVTATRRWGLFRHPVARRWQDGTRALLGDAAHPTLPFLAQGANLALEDAWVLARLVAAGRLGDYGAARRARVQRAVAVAEANARAYHLRGPVRVVAHGGLRLLGAVAPGAVLRRLDWLYRHDVTAAG